MKCACEKLIRNKNNRSFLSIQKNQFPSSLKEINICILKFKHGMIFTKKSNALKKNETNECTGRVASHPSIIVYYSYLAT